MYALIRPDGSVRATMTRRPEPDEFPGHRVLPLTGVREGLPFAAFPTVPEDATEVAAPYDPAVLLADAKRRLADAVQRHLDTAAQARGYDSIHTAVSYAGDLNPAWDAEGQAAKAWRSAVWVACYAVMAEVAAGTRTIPSEAELIAALPAIVWPT
jgi:hypothetical protein